MVDGEKRQIKLIGEDREPGEGASYWEDNDMGERKQDTR
jgi:hypothetical protein